LAAWAVVLIVLGSLIVIGGVAFAVFTYLKKKRGQVSEKGTLDASYDKQVDQSMNQNAIN